MSTGKRIGLFLNRHDEAQRAWAAEARALAAELGCEITEYWSEGINQTRQISDGVWKDPIEALVILPASQSGPAVLLTHALAHGKVVVMIDRTRNDLNAEVSWSLPSLRREFPQLLAACVAPDEEGVGRIQAQQVQALRPGGGHVLYVQGDMLTLGAVARAEGFNAQMAADSRYRVACVDGGWTEERAASAMLAWFRVMHSGPECRVDVVCSQSEVMVPGVRAALVRAAHEYKRPELARVPITACDGQAQYKREVDSGTLAATVEIPSRTPPAVRLCAAFWRSAAVPNEPLVKLQPKSYPALEQVRRRAK
jgi:ABC-type sugar transport system substrate-binding protein